MISIKKYVEKLFREHERVHTLERDSNLRALDAAQKNVDHRLEALNELRNEVLKDRQQFLKNDTYAIEHRAVTDDIHRIDKELGLIREDLSRQKGRSAAFAIVLTVVLVIMSVVVPLVVV